ncbi:bolA-like protein 3 isoform X1 [Tamandua tetradactyla]|uniref:bolA-like protein 3 isoform X1 n=1 Tax=Tamandua tetradactyla TaxID=48850 RepID=UPI0040546BCF
MAAWGPAAAAPLLRGIRGLPLLHHRHRTSASQTEGELKVTRILKEKFPRATAVKVTDISGGCGAMYEIKIESEEFKEKRTVQQHQMVNQKSDLGLAVDVGRTAFHLDSLGENLFRSLFQLLAVTCFLWLEASSSTFRH